jgi:hypothetical protein
LNRLLRRVHPQHAAFFQAAPVDYYWTSDQTEVGKRRFRGLRPFDPDDTKLLEIVSRGEQLIKGFRNREVRTALYGEPRDAQERRRQAARVTRKLAMLRAHGLIKKIPQTHRYTLTSQGIQAITTWSAARNATLAQLTAA